MMRVKRYLSAAMALVMLCVCAGAALAGIWTDEGNYSTAWYDDAPAGTGTKDRPYVISTAQDLAGLSYMMQNDTTIRNRYKQEKFADKYIVLDRDIDLSAHQWRPIGFWSFSTVETDQTIYFKGTFDGQGHRITGLTITDIDLSAYNSCGAALFAEPGGVQGSTHEIRNFFISGTIKPAGKRTWPYAGLVAGSGIFANYRNIVASGDVEANATGYQDGDAGILIGTNRGGYVKNVVTYGSASQTKTKTAGGISGRGGQTSTAFSGAALNPTYLNCVSLASSVRGASDVSSGISSVGNAGINAASKNNVWLAGGADQPVSACLDNSGKAAAYLNTPEQAKTIADEADVKATAALLDSDFLARAHESGKEIPLSLALYPKGADASDVVAEWTFDDTTVTVRRGADGSSAALSPTDGKKKFTVVVRGLNGFEPSESVTLAGVMTFGSGGGDDDDSSDVAPIVEVEAGSIELGGGSVVSASTESAPQDIAAVQKGTRDAMDVISTVMGGSGRRIVKAEGLKIASTVKIDVEHDASGEKRDLDVTIHDFNFIVSAGHRLYALIKAHDSDRYDVFETDFDGETVTTVIRDFVKYFSENRIVFAEARITTDTSSAESSGACGTGCASAAFIALAVLVRRGKLTRDRE